MTEHKPPTGLRAGGKKLWTAVVEKHPDIEETQLVQLTEACRAKDRLDQLDRLLRGDVTTWSKLVDRDGEDGEVVYTLQVAKALDYANTTANSMKQLIAAMRLPDEATGKKPQQRVAPGTRVQTPSGGARERLKAVT